MAQDQPRTFPSVAGDKEPDLLNLLVNDCSKSNELLASQEAVSQQHKLKVLKNFKNILFNKEIKVSGALLHVILTGLPSCGKSMLIFKLLKNNVISCAVGAEQETTGEGKHDRGLSLYELTVVGDSPPRNFHWVANNKYTCYTFCFLSALLNMKESDFDEEESLCFKDPVLKSHFQEAYQRLVRITDPKSAKIYKYDLMKNGLTLVNVWDIGLNVGLFHMLPLLVGMLDHAFPGLVMSLDRDFWHLGDDVDVSMYSKERSDLAIILDQQSRESFLYQFAHLARARPGKKYRENVCKVVLLTERPFDECTAEKIEEIMKKRIEETAAKYGVRELVSTDVIICNVNDQESLFKFRLSIEKLALEKAEETRVEFPLSWVFLRSALYKTGQMYIKKDNFLELAQECRMSNKEAEEFLCAFAGDGSVIYLPKGKIEVFKKYVVLNPVDFFHKLDELFYPHFNGDLSFGLVTESSLCRIIGTSEDNLDFFKCMLRSCHFAFEVDSSRIFYEVSKKNFPFPTIEQCFYFPAICKELKSRPNTKTTSLDTTKSLLVVPDPLFPPGAVRVMVAKYLFDEIKELCLIASKYYNVIEFSHKSKPMSFQLVTHGSMLEFRFEQAVSELPDDTFTASKTVLQLIGDALYFSMTRCFPDETAQTIDACFKYAAICSNGDNTKGIKYHILDKDKDIVIGSCPNCHSIQTLDWYKAQPAT